MDSKSSTAVPMPPPAIRRRGAEDLISGLPDELLHTILIRLKSAAAAARTSVLSRRWRGVWAHMPELVLRGSRARATPTPNPSALLDSIDAALNFYAAPTLHSLKIDVTGIDWCDVPASRIAPWLRFASQRLAGKLCISLCVFVMPWGIKIKEQLALPIFERATEIDIKLPVIFFLRPPPTGSFSALTDLKISCARMDGGELGCVVSSPQCPRLRKLRIFAVTLDPNCDVCICSESVECLDYRADNTGMLEVNAPKLQEISVSRAAKAACIVAPKLENIKWSDRFDPSLHQFDVVKRHLNSLSIMHYRFVVVLISSTRLMERYDTVKELTISLRLHQEIAGYVNFLKEMNKLPVCETLIISLVRDDHGLLPKMLHLLRRCSCIRKFKLLLSEDTPSKISFCTTPGCPCLLPESYRSDDITLDSLEEIGISFFTGSAEQQEFIEVLLSRCNIVTLKRLDIMVSSTPVSSEIMEFVERIRTMYSKVHLNVLIDQGGADATGLLI